MNKINAINDYTQYNNILIYCMFCKYYESVKEMNTCIVHYVLLLNVQLDSEGKTDVKQQACVL